MGCERERVFSSLFDSSRSPFHSFNFSSPFKVWTCLCLVAERRGEEETDEMNERGSSPVAPSSLLCCLPF